MKRIIGNLRLQHSGLFDTDFGESEFISMSTAVGLASMKMAGPHIFCVYNFWGWGLGRGLAPSQVNSIYFNWYIFALALFLYAILPFSVNFTGTILLNRSRHLHVSRWFLYLWFYQLFRPHRIKSTYYLYNQMAMIDDDDDDNEFFNVATHIRDDERRRQNKCQ